MYSVDLYGCVRRACHVEGVSIREAARIFGLHRETVSKMLRFSVPPGYRRSEPVRRPKLDAFTGVIDRILEEDRSAPRKQRHTAKRIFERLRDEHGFEGGYIRDKIAASKAKGIWMGGPVPLGYDLGDRELLVNPTEAELVREIFELYLEKGSVRALKAELDRRGWTSKVRHQRNGRVTGGGPFSRGHLYCLLASPIYVGKLPHKGKLHDGKHQAIIDEGLWKRVQGQLRDNKRGIERASARHPSLLVGRIETSDGQKLIPSHAVKQGRRYRYYIEQRLVQDEGGAFPSRRS